MRNALLYCLLLLPAVAAAETRLYQWQDKASGRTQFSGQAPGWYRGTLPGPRVFVYARGVLVDDTAVAVSEELRQALRAEALAEALDARAGPETVAVVPDVAEPEGSRPEQTVPGSAVAAASAASADAAAAPADESVAAMRAQALEVISRLDAVREEAARALVDSLMTSPTEQAAINPADQVPASPTNSPTPALPPADPTGP